MKPQVRARARGCHAQRQVERSEHSEHRTHKAYMVHRSGNQPVATLEVLGRCVNAITRE
jgi:hypothetical protein